VVLSMQDISICRVRVGVVARETEPLHFVKKHRFERTVIASSQSGPVHSTNNQTNARNIEAFLAQRDTIRSPRYKDIKRSRQPQRLPFPRPTKRIAKTHSPTPAMSDQNPFQSSATASNQENQPQDTQPQEEKKAGADKNQGDDSLYVSPSDAIMSPASQKLSSFKQRQINKYVSWYSVLPA